MARYLVTGGAGFIGSHIVEELVARGEEVVVLDNLATGRLHNLRPFLARIEFRQADLRDLKEVRNACQGVDYVLHQGALPSVPRSVADPISCNDVNISGTLNTLVAARDAGVHRLVYAGSSSAYGDTPVLPKHEDMAANPLSPYALAKYAGELYCQMFMRLYDLETVVLRYFNVFGPRQDPTSQYAAVIPKFLTALLHGESPVVFGDGEQSRDFTYVANVVDANMLACRAPNAPGHVINVACGERVTLNSLIAAMHRALGTDIPPVHVLPRAGDVKHSLADITRAHELIGYQVLVPLEDGLRRTLDWFTAEGRMLP